MPDKGFDDVIRDLEDTIFGLEEDQDPFLADEPEPKPKKEERRKTLPTLVDQDTAKDILKDFLKEKNQRRYEVMGVELMFKPYWFFTYTANLVMRDENKNMIDSEEIGGRVAIDASSGALADYLQDLLDHEPIEIVDLADELGQVGGEAKILEPKVKKEERIERLVKQKISGTLRVEKENVEVAGFELMWSPVYRFWLTIKKKTHNVQIDGCGGYPVNYDDVPLKPKTWFDRLRDDMELLRNPKKLKDFMSKKHKAMRTGGGAKKPSIGMIELVLIVLILALFLYALSKRDFMMVMVIIVAAGVLFWYMNNRRKKPLVPLPPMPYAEPSE